MGERAENFERSTGRGLPAAYRTFVNAFDGGPRVKDGDLEFRLSTADELLAPYTPDGTPVTRPFFSAHIVHLARLRDAGVLIFDGGADPVSPERFESMNTIGVGAAAAAWGQNLPPTHLLVLDPADGSLRAVPIDPPVNVRKVAESFEKWIKAAKRKPRKTTAKKAPAAKAGKAKPPTPATILAAYKKSNKLTLPLAYATFLKTHDGSATFPGPAGEQWSLATLAELADPHLGSVETADGRVPAARLTRVYADRVQNESGDAFVPVYGTKLKFTLARMRKGLCVGHCNGDPMFLDPTTKYSVWGYSRDGKYVGKLADTFATFLKPKAKKSTSRKATVRKTAARKKPAGKTAAEKAATEPTPVTTGAAARAAAKPAAKASKSAVKATKPAVKATKPRAPRMANKPKTAATTGVAVAAPASFSAPTSPKKAA